MKRLKIVHRHRPGTDDTNGSKTLCGRRCDGPNVMMCALPNDQDRQFPSDRKWCSMCDTVASMLADKTTVPTQGGQK